MQGQAHPGELQDGHWQALAEAMRELAAGGAQCVSGPAAGYPASAAPPALSGLRRPQGAAVSVIIPVSDATEDAALKCCLESALRQDLESLEIIAAYAGQRTSPLTDVLDDYALRHLQRLRVLHLDGHGTAAARNAALDAAQGEYVAFMDGHARMTAEFCRRLYAAAAAAAADISKGELLCEEAGGLRPSGVNDLIRRQGTPLYFFGGHTAALYRRDLLLRHGIGFVPSGLAQVEGLLFQNLAILHCRKLVLDDAAQLISVRHEGAAGAELWEEEQLAAACSTVQVMAGNLIDVQAWLDPEGLAYALLRCITLLQSLAGQAATEAGARRCRQLAARVEQVMPYACLDAFVRLRQCGSLPRAE